MNASGEKVLVLIKLILEKQGKVTSEVAESSLLSSIGFRSLDFSELCIRFEQEVGRELNFEAVQLRRIETVSDVCSFIETALEA